MLALFATKVIVEIPDPTFVNRLFAVVLLTGSGVAAGGALSLAWMHFNDARRRVPDARDYFYARVGFALTIGLVAVLLAGMPVVDAKDWRTWVFTAGALMAARGYGNLVRKNILAWWRTRHTRHS